MIVDCHTHMDSSAVELAASDHIAAPETVDVSIVLGNVDDRAMQANKKLAEYVARQKDKRVGFAFVNPVMDKTISKNLSFVTEKLALKGAVLYCATCGFHPTHSRAMRFYESAQELGVPIFFHNAPPLAPDAVLDYAQPFLIDEVARCFPDLRIIIGNMGRPFLEQTLAMVAKHANVFADLTVKPGNVWQIYNVVVSAHEAGVMDKLLFGSGFPHGKAGECIETLLGFNKLLADTNLPTVPRGNIRSIIERDTLEVLGIKCGRGVKAGEAEKR